MTTQHRTIGEVSDMPTAKGKVFFYPQILVDEKWKDLVRADGHIQISNEGSREGWADEYLAQKVVDEHVEQIEKSFHHMLGHG